MSRIDVIKKIAESQPNDPFPRYGLAMEYKNAGHAEEAHATFTELEARWPEYVAAYLMHGNLLASMHRLAEARGVYEQGIAAARKKGDGHALGELESALSNLPNDDD
jgi:tetratricopeptide (TPR) repeat protein